MLPDHLRRVRILLFFDSIDADVDASNFRVACPGLAVVDRASVFQYRTATLLNKCFRIFRWNSSEIQSVACAIEHRYWSIVRRVRCAHDTTLALFRFRPRVNRISETHSWASPRAIHAIASKCLRFIFFFLSFFVYSRMMQFRALPVIYHREMNFDDVAILRRTIATPTTTTTADTFKWIRSSGKWSRETRKRLACTISNRLNWIRRVAAGRIHFPPTNKTLFICFHFCLCRGVCLVDCHVSLLATSSHFVPRK